MAVRPGDQPRRGGRRAGTARRRTLRTARCSSRSQHAAHAMAYIVIANRRYTDLFEWGQRSVPLSLAAEIQHRLLPGSYTCEAGQFTLAAWLEPAGEVGGDTFDFSLGRDALFVSLTDAMGHTVNASLLATLLVASVRNGRRRNADLAEQAHAGQPGTQRARRPDRVRHRAIVSHRPRARHSPDRQRRSSAAAAPARRRRRRCAARRRPAVRRRPRLRIQRADAPARTGRPTDVPHRRRTGARSRRHRRPRHARRHPRRAPPRSRPATHPSRRPSQRRNTRKTTPRHCASTGTADPAATDKPEPAPTARATSE